MPQVDDISGWFTKEDQLVFSLLLQMQSNKGDLLEIGVYKGKSAIFLEYFRKESELLHVCDIFENPTNNLANEKEVEESYEGLSLSEFKKNFLRFHNTLPEINLCDSKKLPTTLRDLHFRFIHIDGSHLYEFVRNDLDFSTSRIREIDGIIAMDDFRSAHTPGVAAAMWESVTRKDLVPIVVTSTKAYLARTTHQINLKYLEEQLVIAKLEFEQVVIGDIDFLRVIDNFTSFGNHRYPFLRKFLPPVLIPFLRTFLTRLPILK